jgi:hypothetical protein
MVFVVKLFTVPLDIANEERSRLADANLQHSAETASLTKAIEDIKSPPKPADYGQAIYQFGRNVGATGDPVSRDGFYEFAMIVGTENLQNGVFVFKDDLYLIAKIEGSHGSIATPHGMLNAVLTGVKCLQLGPVKIAR